MFISGNESEFKNLFKSVIASYCYDYDYYDKTLYFPLFTFLFYFLSFLGLIYFIGIFINDEDYYISYNY